MNSSMILPPALKPGDTIAIIAPAGPIASRAIFDRGISVLEDMGFRVRFDARIFQSSRYLAGSDAARADELIHALENTDIRAVMALRGGYGCARLIPFLRGSRLLETPKIFMGFSDLTVLHLFFNKRFGWATFHGPMAATDTLAEMPEDQRRHLFSLWTDTEYRPQFEFPQVEVWSPGGAEGVLTGGCLSLITAGIGTPYEIETKGKILFLEDCSEAPYRIDRMITHLRLAGKLDKVAGLLLGQFQDCEPAQGGYTVADVLKETLAELNIPILANFPAGHTRDNWTLPLGVRARLDTDTRSVRFLDAAVR